MLKCAPTDASSSLATHDALLGAVAARAAARASGAWRESTHGSTSASGSSVLGDCSIATMPYPTTTRTILQTTPTATAADLDAIAVRAAQATAATSSRTSASPSTSADGAARSSSSSSSSSRDLSDDASVDSSGSSSASSSRAPLNTPARQRSTDMPPPTNPVKAAATTTIAPISSSSSHSPLGPSSNHVSTAIPTHYLRKSSLDCDAVEGYMIMHVKKPRKKLFTLARPSFYVVADARKNVLEVFSNETKSELIYLLSLTNALLSFESDDANMVMEKCFCVEAKTWKKRNTVNFKHQGFVFFEENQVRMLLWVKCIHLAIKTSSSIDRDLFRSSNASNASNDHARLSDDDAELQQQQLPNDVSASASDAAGDGAWSSGAALRKRLVIDPSAPVRTPKEAAKTPLSRLMSLNAMFTHHKPSGKSPRSPPPPSTSDFGTSATTTAVLKPHKEPKTVASVACALLSPKMLGGATAPSTVAKSAFHYSSKASTLRSGGASTTSRSYALHSPFASSTDAVIAGAAAARKRDERTSGSTASAGGTAGGGGYAHSIDPTTDAYYEDVRSSRLREYAVPPKIQRHRSTAAEAASCSDDDALNSASGIAASQTLDNTVAFLLTRCMVLWVAFLGGAVEASIFLPIAAAGVFAHVCALGTEEFAWAALAMTGVFAVSRFQGAFSGVAAIALTLYFWCYGEFKNRRRRRRVRVVDRLLDEERENCAHIDIPNWICHPDVDRVEWLNRVFVTGWPYLKLAIRNSLMGSLNPLLDSVRPAFMSSLSLVRIDLGDRTPHISGVKFVSANPLTEEVTLDVEVRVVTDESLVAELRMVSNLGAAAVVSLRDLFLVGTLRITLNPLCVDWPCFSALSLSFTNRPVFDFSLTAAKINISNVPFASEWLHTFLHDLLNDYFVWPRVVHIPLWDENAPVAAPAPSIAVAGAPVAGAATPALN